MKALVLWNSKESFNLAELLPSCTFVEWLATEGHLDQRAIHPAEFQGDAEGHVQGSLVMVKFDGRNRGYDAYNKGARSNRSPKWVANTT